MAQPYPSRPITIIVPFPAGGPTDTLARIFAEYAKGPLGQPVIVENVAGAGASIGIGRAVAAAARRLHASLGNWTSHVGAGAIYPVNWHILHDLAPVAKFPVSTLMIVGKNDLPANNIKELIAWMKANPGKASIANVGNGSGAHVCSVYFNEKVGVSGTFVPVQGRRAGDAGPGRQPDRSVLRRGIADAGAYPRRQDEGVCHAVGEALGAAAGRADHGGDRLGRTSCCRSGTACGRRRARRRT